MSVGRSERRVRGELSRVLVVDDEPDIRELIDLTLSRMGLAADCAGSVAEAKSCLADTGYQLCLTDMRLPDGDGLQLVRHIAEHHGETPVAVITAFGSAENAVAALKAGAFDYLAKPVGLDQLRALVKSALSLPGQDDHASPMHSLIGHSAAMEQVRATIEKLARSQAPIYISGESGSGKELAARLIHSQSARSAGPFVPVNCGAIPETLMESEFFGYRKGAFTGADRDKPGLLEVAHQGTLFLDELTEMTMPLQAKLLRVLQDGVVRRLGSEVQDAVVDVRFISATNRDPQEAVQQGHLREDLFYRLRVVPIKLPPLRKRVEDIPLLADFFLKRSWERHRASGAPAPELTPETVAFLQSRPWRGNVRELQNVIEHVAVIAEAGRPITPDDIPVYDDAPAHAEEAGLPAGIMNDAFHVAKDNLIAHFEKEYLARLTTRAGGNMSKAARLAGIDRTTLYRLMEKHGFRRDVLSGSVD